MFRSLITLLVAALTFETVVAQIVNIEEVRADKDTSKTISGIAGLDFSVFNQNAGKNKPNNYLQLTFNSATGYNSNKHSYGLINHFNYILVNFTSDSLRNTVANTWYSHFRVNLLRKKRLSYELFVQGQADRARGLEWRFLTGGYFRYRLRAEEKKLNTFLGVGLMYEHEVWQNPELNYELETSDLPKFTNYLSCHYKPTANLEFNGIVYYQAGYSSLIERFRNRVSGDLSLAFKLSKALSFKTTFDCTYEDEPIVPVTKFVFTLANGFAVNF